MDSIERTLCGDLQHFRAALQALKQGPTPDPIGQDGLLQLQRRIAWCEGWLRVLRVSPPGVDAVSPGAPGGAVASRHGGQRRGLAPASSMLTSASAAQSKSA